MRVYGYARGWVREAEDMNLDLQVELLVATGCSVGNSRAEEAGAGKNGRGRLLDLLELATERDTPVFTPK